MQHWEPSLPISIFCAAAPSDAPLLAQWERHLLPLEQNGLITVWSEKYIQAGLPRIQQLHEHLDQALVTALLLSADFFASDECMALMERALLSTAHVIPLLLSPVDWKIPKLIDLVCLPANGQFVTTWNNLDEAFHACVQDLRLLIGLPVTLPLARRPSQALTSAVALATAPAPLVHFVGRKTEITDLTKALVTESRPQAISALQGMGGIGKTALAQQLAVQLRSAFPGGFFWADLRSKNVDPIPILSTWVQLCGGDLGGQTTLQASVEKTRGILTGHMYQHGRIFIILDDVRSEWSSGVQTLLSARPAGVPVLFTTRDKELAIALGAHVHQQVMLHLRWNVQIFSWLWIVPTKKSNGIRCVALCGPWTIQTTLI